MNTGHIKLLADKLANRYAELDSPTGELYRSIVQSNYWKAKEELHEAIEELEAKIKEAFYVGYQSVYNDRVSDPDEEWERAKKALLE